MANTELANLEPVLEINPEENHSVAPLTNRYLCRHIFTDGRRCGSPAMRLENFCYYHHTHRKPVLKRHSIKQHPDYGLKSLDDLEDRSSVQLTLAEILRRVATNSIEPRRATILLYGLQIAAQNLGRRPVQDAVPAASDIVEDPIHGHIATPEPGRFPVPKTDEDRMEAAAALLRQAAALHPHSTAT